MLSKDVRDLLRRQYGLATRPQLLNLGLTRGQVHGLVNREILERYHWGTYRLAGSPEPVEQPAMAACLRCRPRARVSGPMVLGLLGVEGFAPTAPPLVLVPPGRRVQNVEFTVLEDPAFERDSARIGDLPAVTASRGIVDAGLEVTGKPLRVGIDSAKWRGLTSNGRLRACAEAIGHEGAREVLELLDSGLLDNESEGERSLRPVIGDLEPPPRWQYWITQDIRVDCRLADVPVIVEYLGQESHGAQHQRQQDDERDRRIRKLGYHIEHVTKEDLRGPDLLRARLLAVRDAFLSMGRLDPQ